ncbi:MAG: hypothetical protein ACK5MW_07860 [Enterococcus sp.]
MNAVTKSAQNFLLSLDPADHVMLFNDLLAINDIYHASQNTAFYSLKKIFPTKSRKLTYHQKIMTYQNNLHEELIVQQIHQKHFFHHCCQFEIYLNTEEQNFTFIETLLELLRQERTDYFYQQAFLN